MEDLFEKFEIDFLTFDKVENKRSLRPDLYAFLLLDALVPGTDDMVSFACHDEIYLSIEPEALSKVATEDQLRELHRCGVRHDTDNDSLTLFT